MSRLRFIAAAESILVSILVSIHAGALAPAHAAESYPNKPIRMIVNSSPGGLTDVVGRLVALKMADLLGQPFVVVNRAGAAQVGIEATVKSPPDGYTVGVFASAVSTLPGTTPNLPFDPAKDLAAITLINTAPLVLVTGQKSPYRTVADYVTEARAKPNQITIASGGPMTMSHLLGEQLQVAAKLSLLHVPYKGGAPAMADILAGHVPVFFDTIGTTVPLVREGRIRALAVVSKQRSSALPDVPTLAEAGFPEVEGLAWFAMFAPAGTPSEAIAALNAAANKALQSPEIRDRLVSLGTNPEGGTSAALAELLSSEIVRWTRLVKERNLKVN